MSEALIAITILTLMVVVGAWLDGLFDQRKVYYSASGMVWDVWCRIAHRDEWTLYGGWRRPFIYCNRCGATCGYEQTWRSGVQGIDVGVADWKLQEAAHRMAESANRVGIPRDAGPWSR